MLKRRRSILCGGALSAMIFVGNAFAQANLQLDNVGLQDIVVTARKTSESLQTTPVAVTALSAEDLVRQQVVGVTQLQQSTPNLTFSSAVSQPGSATIFMRGQGSSDGLIAIDQAVGAYINGVYLARSTGGAFDMLDVQRVEVLRGPQGTLFGRNTTGGAINIIPNEPTGEAGGEFRVDYGNYDALLVRAVANVPLMGDQVALRVAGQHRQHDGYGTNLVNGQELNDATSDYIRATLKIAPEDSGFSALIAVDYSNFRSKGELVGFKSVSPSSAFYAPRDLLVAACNGTAPIPALNGLQPLCPTAARGPLTDYLYGAPGSKVGFYDVALNQFTYGKSKSRGLSAILTYDLADQLQIKSTTAWRSVNLDSLSDVDGTPYFLGGGFNGSFGNRIGQDQFSQELQLSGKAGIVDYILGGFYFVENGTDVSRSASLFPLALNVSYVDGTVRNRSLAGYGQLIAHVTDSVRVTGGLRYTEDERELVARNRNEDFLTGAVTTALPPQTLDGDPSDPLRASFNRKFNYVSWLGSVDWQAAQDVFLYAKASRSQRSGGFNTRVVGGGTPPISFRPEQITDFEIGAKISLFDRRLRLNLAAFNDDVKDVQRNLVGISGTTLVSGVDNAAKARIRGLESELTIAPGGGFTFGATFGYTDANYKNFINSIDRSDWTNAEFPYTSKYNYSLRSDFERPVGTGTIKLHADYAWRSKQYAFPMAISAAQRIILTQAQIDAANDALQATSLIPSYGLLNGRIAYAFNVPQIEIAIYAQNIAKKKYITRLLSLENTPLGVTSYTPGDPRTFGVSASFRF